MTVDEIISAVTNLGLPVSLCFVLLRYVLKNFEEKFDSLELSLKELNASIRDRKNDSD